MTDGYEFDDHYKKKLDWYVNFDSYFVTDEYSKITPGLFKKEFEGDEIIALRPKMYCVINNKTGETKISCKGVRLSQNNIGPQDFRDVLFKNKPNNVVNKGMRKIDKNMVLYSQKKVGLSSFYDKRHVLDDNISTRPLW